MKTKKNDKVVKKKKLPPNYDSDIKTIKKIYANYGINTDDMTEDELDRLYYQYKASGFDLSKDLKESEKHALKFTDDDIIG